MPGGQAMQLAFEVEPTALFEVPGGLRKACVCIVVEAGEGSDCGGILPLTMASGAHHCEQTEEAFAPTSSLKEPCGQGVQEAAPPVEKAPAAQKVQKDGSVAPALGLYCPAGQGLHRPCPAIEPNVPGGHDRQAAIDTAPLAAAYFPAAHWVQTGLVFATVSMKEPGWQSWQADAFAALLEPPHVPRGQG